MGLNVRYRARLNAVARMVPSTPARWLIALRWVAIAGMLATVVAAHLVAPALPTEPLVRTLAALAAVNVAWLVLVVWRPERGQATVGAQIAVDVVALALVLWSAGGLENPFA